MHSFETQLQTKAVAAMNESLVYNLLLLTSWGDTYLNRKNTQELRLSGEPSTIFNNKINVGSVASGNSSCQAILNTEFDASSSRFILTFDSYDLYSSCSYFHVNIDTKMSYSSETVYSFDARSAVTALAVNMGIIKVNQLVVLAKYIFLEMPDIPYYQMFDSKYPGMDPIYCIDPSVNNDNFCFMDFYGNKSIPTLNSVGNGYYSYSYPVSCPKCCDTIDYFDYYYPNCDEFVFIFGLIPFYTPVDLFTFYYKNKDNFATDFNSMAYSATYGAALGYFWYGSVPYLNFDFCNNTCTALGIYTGTIYYNEYFSSPFYYELENGRCNNALFDANAW